MKDAMSEKLEAVLSLFPFIKPSRIVEKEDGKLASWQFDDKYFEIEEVENGSFEIMSVDGGNSTHWVLTRS